MRLLIIVSGAALALAALAGCHENSSIPPTTNNVVSNGDGHLSGDNCTTKPGTQPSC